MRRFRASAALVLASSLLGACAVACSGNPRARLTPYEPPATFAGIPTTIDLKVTVVDAAGGPIDGADVILQAYPAPRHVTTRSAGVVRFFGIFVVPPRFFIACAPRFICSEWIDIQALEFNSMDQTVTLQRTAAPPRAAELTALRP